VIELDEAVREALSLDYFCGGHLLRFLVDFVCVATRAVLLPLDALGVQALVLVGEIISVFTGLASENDFFAGHFGRYLGCGMREGGGGKR
jgi:hypothetical protein